MEEGSLRCDGNISLRPEGSTEFGTKVEIKNMNSIRSLERALRFEQERQAKALDSGERLVQETRHWNEDEGRTTSMRSKEEAFDYRYFPEPDLPLLEPDRDWIEELRAGLPELPAARRERYVSELGLTAEQANVIVDDRHLCKLFEDTASRFDAVPAKVVANWVVQNLAAVMNDRGIAPEQLELDAPRFAEVILMVDDGTISITAGKQVLEEMIVSGKPASEIVRDKGLRQISGSAALEGWVDEVIAENPGPVEQFRGGKEGVIGFLVGQVMKKTGGAANPKEVGELLREHLA
jgi:aspartyl-tRNA(Asn)/glutamyl-tRNA(Gln) amidotransferase subunit B